MLNSIFRLRMTISLIATLMLAACSSGNSVSGDAIRLDDGSTIIIPIDADLRSWPREALTPDQASQVGKACQREKAKGINLTERVQQLCRSVIFIEFIRS